MVFSGGIRGFVNDLVLGAEETAYKVTHPSVCTKVCTEDDKKDKELRDKVRDFIEFLDRAENEDSANILAEMANKMDDIDIDDLSDEEYEEIFERLSNIELTFNMGDVMKGELSYKESKRDSTPDMFVMKSLCSKGDKNKDLQKRIHNILFDVDDEDKEKHPSRAAKKQIKNKNKESTSKEEQTNDIEKPDKEKGKINTIQDVDEKDTVTFKEAVMSTPLGKRLFEHIDEPVTATAV